MASESKAQIYQRSGLGRRIGFGKRPALLIVDMQVGFTAPERSPLAGNLEGQVAAIRRLLGPMRAKGWPVVYTVVAYEADHQADAGLWTAKVPTLRHLKIGSDLVALDPRIARTPQDFLIVKQYPSAFFGTHLASTLTSMGIDTLIVTGATTSGCVRASVVDALSHGFRPIIPEESVGDRAQEPHEANLFDMDSKYGDVMPLAEVLSYIDSLPADGPLLNR
jgi:nicotinamidase-related amidase